ncbi:MAG: hypothetical protein ACPG4T_16855 [Nannocystaceae bacterium]
MSRPLLILSLMLPAALFASSASADVPPPPGYVEKCTVERQQKDDQVCVSCGDAYHGDRDACKNVYLQQGYTKACQTAGASVWTEIWCRPKTEAEAGVKPVEKSGPPKNADHTDAPPQTRGCHVGDDGPLNAAALLLMVGYMVRRRS